MIRKHLASYLHAFRGIILAFRTENNMIIHMTAGIAVVLVNYLLRITTTEWLITLILIGLAWMAEMFNTAIEKLSNRVNAEHDLLIGQTKDLAAGAVLVICLIAVVCAAIIYVPYVL